MQYCTNEYNLARLAYIQPQLKRAIWIELFVARTEYRQHYVCQKDKAEPVDRFGGGCQKDRAEPVERFGEALTLFSVDWVQHRIQS